MVQVILSGNRYLSAGFTAIGSLLKQIEHYLFIYQQTRGNHYSNFHFCRYDTNINHNRQTFNHCYIHLYVYIRPTFYNGS